MSNELPLVCICIPTYNAAETIRETLKSILAQTYTNLVIHVSDNASTDETLKHVESIADARVTIHSHVENVGGEGNFNRCIQLAEGKYTAIFHADDIYEPDMVAKQVAFLEANPDAGAVFTEATLIDEKGSVIGDIHLPKGISSRGGLYDFDAMFKAVLCHFNFFICPSFMVRSQIYRQEIKVWRGDMFGSSADLDVWLRILQSHPIGHLADKLMRYRISRSQYSARVRLQTEQAAFFKTIDYYLGQDRIMSMLSVNDLRNYRWLERRDRVMRALNCYLMDRPLEAHQLLMDIYSRDALSAALSCRRGLLVLIVGVYVRLLVAMGCVRFGKLSLTYIKRITNR